MADNETLPDISHVIIRLEDGTLVKIDNYADGINDYSDPRKFFDAIAEEYGSPVESYLVKASNLNSAHEYTWWTPDGIGIPLDELPDWTDGLVQRQGNTIRTDVTVTYADALDWVDDEPPPEVAPSVVTFADHQVSEDGDASSQAQTDTDLNGVWGDVSDGAVVEVGNAFDFSGVNSQDTVTQVTLADVGEGATLRLGDTVLAPDANGVYVLEGELLEAFLADQSLLVLDLPQHSDADHHLAVSVTLTDPSGQAIIFQDTMDVLVDAVADAPFNLEADTTWFQPDVPEFTHDISNMVLYLQDDAGRFLKVKIDSFDKGVQDVRDVDDLDIRGFVADHYAAYDLVAVTVKAANNFSKMGPGEGQLIIVDDSLTQADLPVGKANVTWQYANVEAELAGGTGLFEPTVTVETTASFSDYQDGSEQHFVLVQIPDGWTPAEGTTVVTGAEVGEQFAGQTFARFEISSEDLMAGNGTVGISLDLTPPLDTKYGDKVSMNVYAIAQETDLSGEETNQTNNIAVTGTTTSVYVGGDAYAPPEPEPEPVAEPAPLPAPDGSNDLFTFSLDQTADTGWTTQAGTDTDTEAGAQLGFEATGADNPLDTGTEANWGSFEKTDW
jgi:hypothetical protein